MAIVAASGVVSSGMLWLGKENIKSVIHKTWAPPVAPATTNAGNALVQGSRDAATQSFLFGLKIAFSDTDRAASARQYLAATSTISAADRQNDPSLQALTQLAQSIVTRTQSEPASAFISTFR